MGDTPRQEQLDLTTGSPQADTLPQPVGEPVQAGLFPDDSVPDELVGYRGPSACQIAGITYRQLDYWARTSLVVPSIRGAAGSGSQRLYSFKDILVLKIVKRLLDTGISLHNIRVAVDHLRQRGVQRIGQFFLQRAGAFGHFGGVGQPVGAMGDIGPCPRRRTRTEIRLRAEQSATRLHKRPATHWSVTL